MKRISPRKSARNPKKKTSVPPVDSEWIKASLNRRGLTQRDLAKLIGVDNSVLVRLIQGTRRLQLDEAVALSKALSVPFDELVGHFGVVLDAFEGPGTVAVPIEGWIDGNLAVHHEGIMGQRTAPYPFGEQSVKAVRFQTLGTPLSVFDGQTLFYQESKAKGGDPSLIGGMCLVRIKGDPALRLRVVLRGYTSGRYNLAVLNGTIAETDAPVIEMHPVLWWKMGN